MNFNKDNFKHHPSYCKFITSILKKELETMSNIQETDPLEISLNTLREELSKFLSRDATVVKVACINDVDEPIGDEFETFLSHYSHLEVLSMKGIGLISNDHLKIIGGKLKKLRSLGIAMNTSITDLGLGYLSGENELSEEVSCPLLESLDIKKATGITIKGVLPITSRLQNLEHLGLWVNEVDKNVVQCIAGMKSFKSVILRNQDSDFLGEHEEVMTQAGFVNQVREMIDENAENGSQEIWTRHSQPSPTSN